MNSDLTLFNKLLNEKCYENDDNLCLIDGTKLENNFITLNCGHSFNYLPLYNEIVYQKTKKILDNSKLRFNEIKCPYCRNVSNKLLPAFKYYNIEFIKGVNYPCNYSFKINNCEYLDKNKKKCNNSACITKYGIFCNKHFKYTKTEEEILDNIDCDFYKSYKKKNLKEIKEELRKYKLKLSGKKNDLIKRLYIKTMEIIAIPNNIENIIEK